MLSAFSLFLEVYTIQHINHKYYYSSVSIHFIIVCLFKLRKIFWWESFDCLPIIGDWCWKYCDIPFWNIKAVEYFYSNTNRLPSNDWVDRFKRKPWSWGRNRTSIYNLLNAWYVFLACLFVNIGHLIFTCRISWQFGSSYELPHVFSTE